MKRATSKSETYLLSFNQIQGLLEGERDLIANFSNVIAVLKENFNFFWIGYYFVKGEELVLGPFQGSVACTRIKKGRGVCGACWKTKETMLVPNVEEFPGHIACSSLSRSEIVIPLLKDDEVFAVLDIDSDKLNDFNETDQFFLEKIAQYISQTL